MCARAVGSAVKGALAFVAVTYVLAMAGPVAAASPSELLQRPEDDSVHQIGDATFDLVSHKLTRGGEEIPLTTKEYRMLEYFVRRPNRALARSDIIDRVWGRSVIVTSRSVDRCITTLRGKIEPDPRQPTFIHTIRNVGYRFELPD